MGFNPDGDPQVKKLKFIEILNQLVQVNESTLHLLLRSLSLHTVAVDLVDSDQRTAAPLQFLNDLQNQVHSLTELVPSRRSISPTSRQSPSRSSDNRE